LPRHGREAHQVVDDRVGQIGKQQATDDEGAYVSQAWAVLEWRTLAHYTYWYDHPPFRWTTIAGYSWVTQA
jgi:hypothetical protein